MADTQRTKAQILAMFADNVTQQISPQDLRDWVVTMMESEFVNPGDFFAQPESRYTLTDRTGRGWILYSQVIGSVCSFGNIMMPENSSGNWILADCLGASGMIGVALDSYAVAVSTAQILLRGCIYHSVFSATFSGNIGRPVFLASGASGSITVTLTSAMRILGAIMPSDAFGASAIGKYFFAPDWAVRLR